MRYIFKFPDIGEGITEGTLLKWYVEKGQKIQSGEPVCQMETDKVVADIPSPKDGVIAERYGKVGEVINVDDALVEIEIEGVEGEAAQEAAKEKPKGATQQEVKEEKFGVVGTIEDAGGGAFLPASEEGVGHAEPPKPERRKALATPVARAMAKDLGVDIDNVRGTGPGGRVMKQDILKHRDEMYKSEGKAPAKVAEPETDRVEYVQLTQIRKTIAKNMIISKQNAAHLTIFDSADVSELVRIRAKYKEKFAEQGAKLTYLPFIMKALVAVLKKYRDMNSEMDLQNNRMIYKNYYNIGIAVDTEAGLVVPVIKDVDKLSVKDMTEKLQEISEKSRKRKLTVEDLKDGTFSITNFGALGGLYGTPVINYPQAGILGIGRIEKQPVVKNDEIIVGQVLPLSLTVDHRIIDGGTANRFLIDFIKYLEDPVSLMIV